MRKLAILISGHIRNLDDIIDNLYNNLIKIILSEFEYDIYIHTWDNNITYDKIANSDIYYEDIRINTEYIKKLFNNNNMVVKKIIIENQKQIRNELELEKYMNNNTQNRSIHNNLDNNYVKSFIEKLFFQYYGHYKVLSSLDLDCKYNYIIKTRPDMLYEKFDINLFKYDIFFPNSHQRGGNNINQLFFGGKTEYMINILKFFEKCIFYNKNMNFNIINKHDKTDINLNELFRYYIINYLNYKPFFTNYNPKIYRNKEHIITII